MSRHSGTGDVPGAKNKRTNESNREKYLRVFEIVVKKSGPWCVHGRGLRAGASKKSNQQILLDEWNFDGLLVSDAARGEAKTIAESFNGAEG